MSGESESSSESNMFEDETFEELIDYVIGHLQCTPDPDRATKRLEVAMERYASLEVLSDSLDMKFNVMKKTQVSTLTALVEERKKFNKTKEVQCTTLRSLVDERGKKEVNQIHKFFATTSE